MYLLIYQRIFFLFIVLKKIVKLICKDLLCFDNIKQSLSLTKAKRVISTTETSKQEIIAEIDTENHKNNDAISFLKEDSTGVTKQH